MAKQNVTRVLQLSAAFDYRKEINLEQYWPFASGNEEENRESIISGIYSVEVRVICPPQPVKNKTEKYFE